MRWAIEIEKTSLEKRNLSDLLHGLKLRLVEGIEYPALTSQEIDNCLTANEVFEKANAVQEAFKDVARIDTDFTLGFIIDYSTNPPRRCSFSQTVCIGIGTDEYSTTVAPRNGLSQVELEQWQAEFEEQQYQAELEQQRLKLEPAYFCERAAKVLKLLNKKTKLGKQFTKYTSLW